jgi:hypothetical protein
MARALTDIITSIFADKNSRPELSTLTSTSKAAVWRNWVYVAANAQQNLETIQDRFEAKVNDIIANNFIGTVQWYAERSKEFQLGYDLTLNGTKFGYSVVVPDAQIIKAVSVTENSGSTLYIKVAKEDSNGDLIALPSQEKTQFQKYITKIKLAGTKINVVSLTADQLIMSGCTIYYDSIFAESVVKEAVETALREYTKSIPFDGKVRLNDIIDVIQKVSGVNDVELDNLAIKSGFSIIPVDRIIELPAGYVNEASDPGLSFDDLISYVGI